MSVSSRITIDPKPFAETLQRLRRKKGFSQHGLATEMTIVARDTTGNAKYPAIPVEWVRRIEQGHMQTVSSERVALAALALGVTVSDLLPAADAPPATITDIALALRGYGMPDAAIRRILTYIESQKDKDTRD